MHYDNVSNEIIGTKGVDIVGTDKNCLARLSPNACMKHCICPQPPVGAAPPNELLLTGNATILTRPKPVVILSCRKPHLLGGGGQSSCTPAPHLHHGGLHRCRAPHAASPTMEAVDAAACRGLAAPTKEPTPPCPERSEPPPWRSPALLHAAHCPFIKDATQIRPSTTSIDRHGCGSADESLPAPWLLPSSLRMGR